MKKYLFVAMLGISFPFLSQQNGTQNQTKRDKVEQLKIAYITKGLELNEEQAKVFWPIYNEMTEKVRAVNKSKRLMSRQLKEQYANLKDAEIKEKLQQIYDKEQEELSLKKTYGEKLAATIGYQKSVKLLILEHQFKQELMTQLKNKKGSQPNRQPKE